MFREHTGSAVARKLLAGWDGAAEEFVKVMPVDYKRIRHHYKSKNRRIRS